MPIKKIKRGYRKTRYILYKETLIDYKEHFWAFLGSFFGIGIIAYMQSKTFMHNDVVFLIGSFGASSVLVYGIIQSPFSQPRNLIGGHLISSIVGVTVAKFVPDILWLTAPLAVFNLNCLNANNQNITSARRSNRLNCHNRFSKN